MADKEPVKAVEESDGVKGLLSIIEMLGDSMTVADRAKYDEFKTPRSFEITSCVVELK